VTLSRLF